MGSRRRRGQGFPPRDVHVQDSDYSLLCSFSEVFGRDGLAQVRQFRFQRVSFRFALP
jgi:hypothetical protein